MQLVTWSTCDVDATQELIAIQQNGPKALGFFGTRNMGFLHQNLIEILSYAMVLTVSIDSAVYDVSNACTPMRPACLPGSSPNLRRWWW